MVIIFEVISNQVYVIKVSLLTVVVGVGAADRGEGLSSFAWEFFHICESIHLQC